MSGFDTRPLSIPSYATSISFPYPTTAPCLLSPGQLEPFPPPVIFHGAPLPQNTFDYQDTQHQHHSFSTSPHPYPHHHHTGLPETSPVDITHTSRKRPRVESETMPCFPFELKLFTSRDDEKSPEHDYPDDGRCVLAGWNPFGGPYAPGSDYGHPPCKQPFPGRWLSLSQELTWS